jgi:transcriptional regulator with XRE-family HTH domain
MNTKNWFKNKLESFKDDFEFRLETLILELTEKICKRMNEKKINRTHFAERLNITPPAVTKILNGNSNFTLKTLLSIADALELNLKIRFEEKEIVTVTQPVKGLILVPSADENVDKRLMVVGPVKTYSSGKVDEVTSNTSSSTAQQKISEIATAA